MLVFLSFHNENTGRYAALPPPAQVLEGIYTRSGLGEHASLEIFTGQSDMPAMTSGAVKVPLRI
jgi:hypothetical protein